MENYKIYITAVLLIVLIVLTVRFYFRDHHAANIKITTRFIVRVAIFGAIAAVLYIFIKFPVPIFPAFMEFHFDEIPILIAGFAYGPLAGFAVTVVKTLIKLPMTSTMGVGELCDFLYTTAFVVPAAFVYKRHRNIKGAIIGLLIGMVAQLVAAVLGNMFIIIPFYMRVMEYQESDILYLCQKANAGIKDLKWTYSLFAVLPFNAIKDVGIIVVTFMVYKTTRRFIDKLQ